MENLLKSGYICNPQLAYILRKITVSDGKAKGTTVIEVCTTAVLQVDILPDAGLEPTNCYIMGRAKERENGTLPVLKAFESIETQVCFQFESI